MENQKSNRGLVRVLILISVLLLLIMCYVLFGKKLLNINEINNTTTSKTTKIILSVKYTYTSGDNAAVQGNPSILEVYELTDNELKFAYNKAFNFNTNVTDRHINGVALKVANNVYEYKETSLSHNYKLKFTINNSNNSIELYEYDGEDLIGTIYLYK